MLSRRKLITGAAALAAYAALPGRPARAQGIPGVSPFFNGAGLISRINLVSTTDNQLSSTTGQTVPSYSYIEIICEAGPGGGYVKSTFTSSSGGRPTVGAAITAQIDRRNTTSPKNTYFSCSGLASFPYATDDGSSSSGPAGSTINQTGGTAWRLQVNYIP